MPIEVKNRLPIQHPEYLYPQSRNPYWSRLQEVKNWVYSDNDTEKNRGSWRKLFSSGVSTPEKKLHVEIGCNAGHVILEWATREPEQNYIGIDWKFKSIHRGMEKGQERGLKNLLFFRAHAERLPYMFGPQEIDRLYLFFPDPWPRKGHWKNRFISEDTLKKIAPLMKPDGIFHIKTDHRGYFDWMLDAVSKSQTHWKTQEMSMDLHQGNPSPQTLKIPEVTLFEQLFIRKKQPIHSLKLTPK